jgi:hypothetical protein
VRCMTVQWCRWCTRDGDEQSWRDCIVLSARGPGKRSRFLCFHRFLYITHNTFYVVLRGVLIFIFKSISKKLYLNRMLIKCVHYRALNIL